MDAWIQKRESANCVWQGVERQAHLGFRPKPSPMYNAQSIQTLLQQNASQTIPKPKVASQSSASSFVRADPWMLSQCRAFSNTRVSPHFDPTDAHHSSISTCESAFANSESFHRLYRMNACAIPNFIPKPKIVVISNVDMAFETVFRRTVFLAIHKVDSL